MLQIAPEKKAKTDDKEKIDDAIYCSRCGHLVSRSRWKIAIGNECSFTNPAGYTFQIVCFANAPGASPEGEPTDQHTWFTGYLWCFALCKYCNEHLGWHYQAMEHSQQFFGLIKEKLSSQTK